MAKRNIKHLNEQFKSWFCEYGSHVVLHRAVPHIEDGLKPSQRRVLHAMNKLEDGRYNKVAGIIGNTADYHPHGDMSIFETLIGVGQKGYLIDMGGNWGNVLTGDGAAAPRYIEGRLTPFAKEIMFNPKITVWQKNYDGRKDEPVTLPVKFPLLLLQGTEGIAVSLACKILPHNFIELCNASISYLKGEPFTLTPDFQQGGEVDASAYQDGLPGGKVKVRCKIVPHGKHGLEITETPFGSDTTKLLASILDAESRGKIKIKHIEDLTSEKVSMIIELANDQDQETTIQALYAFTDCEMPHSPIGVVVENHHPVFMGVSDMLKRNIDRSKALIKQELELYLQELSERWHKLNLERIFIEKKAYLQLEDARTPEEGINRIKEKMKPFLTELRGEPSQEDFEALTEMRIRRISKYDSTTNTKDVETVEKNERETKKKLNNLTQITIEHFENIKAKYGEGRERKTRISQVPFGKIEAASVAVSNQKLYCSRDAGFIGTGLKKDELLPFEINSLTDIVAVNKNGILKVNRPGEKTFYGEGLLDIRIVEKKETAPIYNLIYEDKSSGITFAKRFQIIGGFVRDKVYTICGGNIENKVLYLKIQEQKETPEKLTLILTNDSGARKKEVDFDFSELTIKNRDSQGNRVTKYKVNTVSTTK